MAKLNQTDRVRRWGATFMTAVLLGTVGTTLIPHGSLAIPTPIAQSDRGQKKTEADRLLGQGLGQFNVSQFEGALQSWQQALVLYRQLQDRLGEGNVLGNLGNIYYSLGDYPKAIEFHQQSLAIAREIKDRLGEGQSLGSLGNAYYSLGDYLKAIEFHQQSLAIAREIKDRLGEGQSLGNLGNIYFSLGDYPKAIEFHQQSLAITREIKDRLGEGNALGNLGNAYSSLGDYPKAIEFHQQSLAIAREIKNRLGEGNALGNLGITYYSLGNYIKAIEFQQQRLAIAREIKDRFGEGGALGNLGNAYSSLGDYPKAIDFQQQHLAITREIKDRFGEGSVLGNLGITYRLLGDYPKAIEFHQQSLAIAREIKNRLGEGNALGNLGSAYFSLGDYPKAIEFHQQSLAIARELKDRLGEGQTLGNLGNVYYDLGDYPKAIEFHQQSLAIARELKDRLGEGQTLGNLGNVYYDLGDYPKAIEFHQQSLAIAREIKDRLMEGQSLGNLGLTYSFLRDYPKAIEFHQQSLAIAREIKDRLGEGQSLNNLGRTLFRADKLADAEASLLNSIQIYESLRDKLSDAERVSIADTQRNAYSNLQQVLVAQKKVTQALEIAERGRARAFVQLLTSRLNQQTSKQSVPVSSINLEQMRQVARTQNATLVSYSVIYDAQLLIWVIQPTGDVAFRQVDLKLLQPQKMSLDKLVATARCFGEFRCERRITERRIASRGTPGQQTSVIAFDRTLSDQIIQGIPTLPTPANPALQQLHQLLIEPIAPLLPKDPNAHVVFVPQGSLFLVPFAALQDAEGTYLIDQHTIRVAPSIQVLQLTHQQKQQMGKAGLSPSLIVGNPTMPGISRTPGEPPVPLSSLPGAQKEAETIASLLGTKALTGGQATKAAVLQLMTEAKLIHLATHGSADAQQGLQSWIALAPSGKDSGFLTADEILNLKLRAELVVLSACETGQGRISGDGVIGLSRSLISAGAPSVLVSLWQVDDAATLQLMTRFYQELKRNPNRARALRQAMLATKQTDANPDMWAAFILIGEME